MESIVKICTKCGQKKPLADFNKQAKGKFGHTAQCKNCEADYRKSPEVRAKRKARYASDNVKRRKDYIVKHYGIQAWMDEMEVRKYHIKKFAAKQKVQLEKEYEHLDKMQFDSIKLLISEYQPLFDSIEQHINELKNTINDLTKLEDSIYKELKEKRSQVRNCFSIAKQRIRSKLYYTGTSEQRKLTTRKHTREATDGYIKQLIVKTSSHLTTKEVENYPELIKLYRKNLFIKRITREK